MRATAPKRIKVGTSIHPVGQGEWNRKPESGNRVNLEHWGHTDRKRRFLTPSPSAKAIAHRRDALRKATIALTMNPPGKLDAGNLHVRFEEGGQVSQLGPYSTVLHVLPVPGFFARPPSRKKASLLPQHHRKQSRRNRTCTDQPGNQSRHETWRISRSFRIAQPRTRSNVKIVQQ